MEQHNEKPSADHVLKTPLWITIIRGLQILLSLIILACCARLMHDAYLDEEGLCLAVSILTWLGVGYIVFSEKIPSLHGLYHIVAVLAIDAFFLILWLAAWAATAARRASFVYNVNVGDCFDDGSVVNSKSCTIFKRGVVLFRTGLALLAAVAGLGALVWVLFIATFVWTLIQFLRGRKEGRFALGSPSNNTTTVNVQMENKTAEAQPMTGPQTYQNQGQPFQPEQQQFQQQPVAAGQYAPQQPQQYPQGVPYQQPQSPYQPSQSPYQQTQSPYQPQAAYPPPAQGYSTHPQQQQPTYMQPVQPYGSELSGEGQTQYTTPPPAAVSPPPQNYNHN